MPREKHDIHNRFLLALPGPTLEALLPSMERVSLAQGQTIDHANGPVSYLYFVNRGFISLVKTMRDGRTVEVGAVGIEGLTDPTTVLGTRGSAILDAAVQVPGAAFRIERSALKRHMQKWPGLQPMIEDYARFIVGQIARTAACNRLHAMEERCCRWMLVAADNALAKEFPLTHEFLAMMLGVQRAGVSIVARSLKKAGLIDYSRGELTILDREGLEEAACECYAANRQDVAALYAA